MSTTLGQVDPRATARLTGVRQILEQQRCFSGSALRVAVQSKGVLMRVRRLIAVLVLALGVVLVIAGVVLIAARIGVATDVVRETGADFAAAYFLGSATAPADLVSSIGPIVLVVLGLVLSALAYGRVVSPGESVATARIGWHPLASREAIREAGRGRY